MTRSKTLLLAAPTVVLFASLLLTSCSSPGGEEVVKGRSQMWQENCNRCHNFRDPGSLSDSQWRVALLHMRVRANLTAEEHDGILEFLQAGN